MSSNLVTVSFSSSFATLTLNDPHKLNALSLPMAAEFKSAVNQIKLKQNSLRAVILTGAGKAFSAGGDLDMLRAKQTKTPETNKKEMLDFYNSFLCITELDIPVIAAINGAAIGAGLCVAAACDFRIATTNSKLGFTFSKLGLFPGMGATYFLPKVIGDAYARELLITGRVIDANESLKIGLISAIVEESELKSKIESLVNEISTTGPEVTKQIIKNFRGKKEELNICLEQEAHNQSINYNSAEFKEGLAAVAEKRDAKWD